MRQIIFIAIILFVSSNLFADETLLLDFESGTVPSSVASWLNYSKSGTSASTWAADNPKVDEVNGTEGCYKIEKTDADPYWTGLEITMANSISITSANQYLHVLVYKNTTSRIALTYTPEGGNQSYDAWQAKATTGEWIDYVLSIPVGTKLKTFAIKIADDPGVYYFDQITLSGDGTSASPTMIFVDPADQKQVLEGWGASLCWWANIMGGFSDAKINTLCKWITDPDGLNMNVFRFNIGGGDDPSHNHMRSDGGDMPGYKASATAAYDWTQDENQRKILEQLIASRIEKAGVNDIQLVAFSNSPPYWMTKSGCSAGSTDGSSCNLKDDMFDDFADYLTEVVKHYHDDLGITFNYLEPFNEPDANWWKAFGGQEGCSFSNNDQMQMIRELYNKLKEKEMLAYCRITANDANNLDHAYNALQSYKNQSDVLPMFDMVSTHSYGGNNRSLLATWAEKYGKKLWQSESGPLYVGNSYESQVMIMADRIITDLRELKCTAWCDWQIAGSSSNLSNPWALIVNNYDDNLSPVLRNTNYYLRAQFSRYLKAGYIIIGTSASNSVAAVSPDKKQLVLVISNSATYTQKYKVDLSEFSGFGKVKQFRTRAQESFNLKNSEERFNITGDSFIYDAKPECVTTFLIPITDLNTKKTDINKPAGKIYYSRGNLYTSFPNLNTISISVYNSAGQLIISEKRIPAQGSSPLNIKDGIYLIYTNLSTQGFVSRISVSH